VEHLLRRDQEVILLREVAHRDTSPAFMGRRAELERLDTAWELAGRGEPQVLLIGAEAGMGKTRLVAEFLTRCPGARMTAVGGCVPVAGGSLAYIPFIEILRSLAAPNGPGDPAEAFRSLAPASRAELGRLVPSLRSTDLPFVRSDDALARARLFEAVLDLVVGVSARLPTLLVVEDLHWADGSSLDLLGYVIRNLRADRVLILATYRTDELHRRHPLRPWMTEVCRLGLVDRLELPRLDPDDVRPEIARLLGAETRPALIDRIIERADGNPLFATELVAFVQRRGHAEGLPEILREGFLHRLEALSPDALVVVRHLAVIGRPATGQLLQQTCRLDPDRVQIALREALDGRVIAISLGGSDGRFEMRHALLGEAVIDDLLPDERTALHRTIADTLEVDDDVGERGGAERARIAGEIAYHRWSAHDTDRALRASIRAAVAAGDARAFVEADAQWTRALEAWPVDGPGAIEGFDIATAILEAASAAAALGDYRRAADLAERSLDRIDATAEPLRAAEVHRRLMWYLVFLDWRAAFVHSARAVRLLPRGEPPPGAARILADHAGLLAQQLHLERAEALARRALEIAGRGNRPDAEMLALHALGNCLASSSRHADAIEAHRRAFALADRLGDAEGLMATGNGLSWSLIDAGRYQEALGLGDRFAARVSELGLGRRCGWDLVSHRVEVLLLLGRWGEAEPALKTRLFERGLSSWERALAAAPLALLRTRQNRIEEARELAELAGNDDEPWCPEPLASFDVGCEIALADRRWLDAREIVATAFGRVPVRVRPMAPDLRLYVAFGLQAEAELALEARVHRDRAGEAEAVRIARELAGWAHDLVVRVAAEGAPPAARTIADAALADALLTRVERQPDPDAWRKALELHDALGHRYTVAQIRYWLAEAVLDSGGARSEAAAELGPALETASELGAVLLEREIRDLAQRARLDLQAMAHVAKASPIADAAGGAPAGEGRQAIRPDPDELVEQLTPREREVLGYLAMGWTNRRIGEALFISDRTVGVHVSNLMGKLGAANRAEAALIADRLGLIGPRG
jgi:DNA-binding CsgD family transcriptional regulator